jgi:DNA (cytosine-5)-methyltransferase 1
MGAAVDSEAEACRTLARNHRRTEVLCTDIREVAGSDLLDAAGFTDADVVIGGPSCQGFSTQGRRGRWASDDDPRNLLYREYARLLGELRPEWFVMENVPGLLYWNNGAFGERIFRAFARQGYRIWHRLLLAADFGVPQLRKRLFVVGTLTDYRFQWPTQTHMGAYRRDAIDLWERRRRERYPHLARHRSLWDAIGDLPPVSAGGGTEVSAYRWEPKTDYQRHMRGRTARLYDHQATPLSEAHRQLIRHVQEGQTWRDIPRELLPERFQRIRRTDGTNLFARPDRNRPSYTIITQFGNVTTGAYTHPSQDRALSAREGARIQSFRDSYRFYGPLSSKYRQVGNAVPPMLARAVALAVRQAAGERVPARRTQQLKLSVA